MLNRTKKVSILLLVTIAISLFAGSCASERANNEPENTDRIQSQEDNGMKISTIIIDDELEYIHISICDGTLSNAGATILFENKSEKYLISHSETYALEQYIDGAWYEMPLVIEGEKNTIAIENTVLPSTTKRWNVDWSSYYGNLTVGQYRIIKHVIAYKNPDDIEDSIDYRSPEEERHLSLQFSID